MTHHLSSSIVVSILQSDTRTPDAFVFMTWQNDSSGLVGSGSGTVCSNINHQIMEANTDDNSSGMVINFLKFFHVI